MLGNTYANEGFASDDAANSNGNSNNLNKTGASNGGSGDNLKTSNTNASLNSILLSGSEENHAPGETFGVNTKKVDDEDSTAFYSAKKDGGGMDGGGSVDFTLPPGVKGRERSKSLYPDEPYRGMGKEELLRFSSRPFWRNLRYACISIVLTGWLALLITVVALVLTYPHCRDAQRKDWWQKTVVYRIYVRSFMDSQSDGIGDLKGIIQQLDYLKETGVGTISLSPIYKLSPDAVGDTHIVNHTDIDPVFGTFSDFKDLVNKTHALGMNLILDFIPNHTSDQHPWFVASKADSNPRKNTYRSYYVWEKGTTSNQLSPPNSWQSIYNCTAWTFTTVQNFHYLHQFTASQPELNLRSEKVRRELESILQFWLDLGVDGFYIRDADYLFEDYDLRDNPVRDNSSTISSCGRNKETYPYDSYTTKYTKGLNEVFDMLARWRYFLDEYGNATNKYKMLIADVEADYNHVMNYYGLFNRDGVDFPLNKVSLNLDRNGDGMTVGKMVKKWLSSIPHGRWANWMGGDDRSDRLTDRLGPEMSMPYLIMTMLLPGTPYMYYGDEIGMGRSEVNVSNIVPGGREMTMRGPMLWNNKTHAGFCPQYCKQPWIAPYSGYKSENINVEAQKRDPYSMWHLFKNLTQLRKDNPSFHYGDYRESIQDSQVFSFVREFDGKKGFLVALNFGRKKAKRHFTGTHDTIPSGGTIEIVSGKTSRRRGKSIGLNPLTLDPYQGVVVSWDYVAKEI